MSEGRAWQLKHNWLPVGPILMVIGIEGIDWWPYETDPEWWAVRLLGREN